MRCWCKEKHDILPRCRWRCDTDHIAPFRKAVYPLKMADNGRKKNGQFATGHKIAKGRPPKVKCIPDILRKIGEEEGTQDGKTKLDVIMYKVYQYALEGKPWAVQFIADRTEGKALDRIEATINQEPIKVFDIE